MKKWKIDTITKPGYKTLPRCIVDENGESVCNDLEWRKHKEAWKMANLLCAAPDLLEACQAVMEWAEKPTYNGGNILDLIHDVLPIIDEAINKAKGIK